jgi:uncharacterized protein
VLSFEFLASLWHRYSYKATQHSKLSTQNSKLKTQNSKLGTIHTEQQHTTEEYMTQTLPFPNLQGQQYASLVTFRKSGEGVPTPVWFAQEGNKLYVVTLANAGKAKRIRNNPKVTLAPCTASGKVTGSSIEATARVLSDAEGEHANKVLEKKYGLIYAGFRFMWRIRNQQPAFIEISSS